ncbi:MAG TPA: aminopeptidase P family protein, partial [Sneathiellales bacterium]|nr:aminopeptidase P family protein [Sneathiellales bacterium]
MTRLPFAACSSPSLGDLRSDRAIFLRPRLLRSCDKYWHSKPGRFDGRGKKGREGMLQRVITPPGTENAEIGHQKVQDAMRPFYPRFSDQEYERRRQAVREEMAKQDLSCLVMYSSGYCVGNQKNLHYLTNLISYLPAYLVFPLEGEPTLYMMIYSFIPGGRAISNLDDVRWSLGADGPAARIKELGLENTKIGLVGEDILSSSVPHDHFEYLAGDAPNAIFENFTFTMHSLMKIPSTEELEWYKKGAAYSDLGVAALFDAAEPGVTDNQLYAQIQQAYMSQPNGVFYFTWMGSTPMADPACSYPFGLPSGRTLQKGDIILTEISGAYHGYAGQIMRPVMLGKPPPLYQDLFDLAEEVYFGVREVLKPGNTPRDVLKVSQKILDAGYSTQCPTIHGWGQRII